MGNVIHAEVTVEFDDMGGYTPEQYIDGLERNIRNAVGDGMLTGATPELEVEEYSMSVTYNPDSRVDDIEAYYADAIANGKIELGDIPAMLARNGLEPVSDFIEEILTQLPPC